MSLISEGEARMVSIWYFIGIAILVIGIAVAITGAVRWNHPAEGVAMSQLHADLWWGLIMTGIGLYYVIRYGPAKVVSK